MLELIFQGFLEWAYGLALECWQYFSTALLDIMSMDFAYLKSHAPVVDEIMQILLAVGWALLIGNLVFQALKSMAVGLGFEGEDPKLLFARTFVFAFLLLASPQICEIGLSMTSKIIELLQIPDAVNVTFVDESVFGAIGAAWLLVIIFGIIVMFNCRAVCHPRHAYDHSAAGLCYGRQQKHLGDFHRLVPDVRQYVPFDGDKCDFLQNAAVCSCHSSQRFRCSPVDRADPYDCQGRTESRRHCNTHRLKSRHHRRLSGKRTPRASPQETAAKALRPTRRPAAPAWAGPAEVMATRRSMSGKAQRSKAAQIKAHHRNRLMRKAPQYIQARRNHPRRKSPPHLLRRTVCLKIRQRQGPRRNGKVLFLSAHAALRHISRLQQRYRLSVRRMHPADPVRQEKLALRHAPVWRERQRLFKAACAPQPRSA